MPERETPDFAQAHQRGQELLGSLYQEASFQGYMKAAYAGDWKSSLFGFLDDLQEELGDARDEAEKTRIREEYAGKLRMAANEARPLVSTYKYSEKYKNKHKK